MSVSARVLGIIRHPRQTLQEVASHPTWVSLLVALTLATAAAGRAGGGHRGRAAGPGRSVGAHGAGVWPAGRRRPVCRITGPGAGRGRPWRPSMRGAGRSGGGGGGFAPGVRVAAVARHKTAPVSYSQVLAVVVHAGVILALGRLVAAPLGLRPRDHGQRHDPGAPGFRDSTRLRRSPAFLGQSTCSRCGGSSCWGLVSPCCRDAARGPAPPGWCLCISGWP